MARIIEIQHYSLLFGMVAVRGEIRLDCRPGRVPTRLRSEVRFETGSYDECGDGKVFG